MAVKQNLTLTEVSYSIPDNTSVVRLYWTSTQTGGSHNLNKHTATYTFEGVTYNVTYTLPLNTTQVIADVTFTVKHNPDGKKSVTASTWMDTRISAGVVQLNASLDLTTIPRQAHPTVVPNFTDEENPTIQYTNPAGTAVSSLEACISLDGKTPAISYKTLDKTSNSFTFNLTESERNVLRNATTTSNSRTIHFIVKTVIAGVTYLSSLPKTLTIVNCQPVANPDVYDESFDYFGMPYSLTLDKNTLVKYRSTAVITPNAQALKGASLKQIAIINGSKSLTIEHPEAERTVTIPAVDSGTFLIGVTDSRGNQQVFIHTCPFVEYVNLTATIGNNRPSTDGKYSLSVTGNYFNNSFGSKGQDNVLYVSYRYKVTGGEYGSWTQMNIALDGNTYTATALVTGLDYRATYVFQIHCGDLLQDAYPEKTVQTIPVFDYSKTDFNFNVPITIQGNPLEDYVIDQGTSGTWFYRKWNSGYAECWQQVTVSSGEWSGSNPLYYSVRPELSLPSGLFLARPDVSITISNAAGAVVVATCYDATTSTIRTAFLRAYGGTDVIDIVTNYFVTGRWK